MENRYLLFIVYKSYNILENTAKRTFLVIYNEEKRVCKFNEINKFDRIIHGKRRQSMIKHIKR